MVVMRVLGDQSVYAFEFDGEYEGCAIRGRVPWWWAFMLMGSCQG
jgi:hypothetical protein